MEADLQTKYTAEERDALFEAGADACGIDDLEDGERVYRQLHATLSIPAAA